MKTSFIRVREQAKNKKQQQEMLSECPASISEVREMMGIVMQPCKGFLQVFHFFFLIKWHQLLKAL